MKRQRFTRSLRINFSQISLFLFGHFFLFGPGATWTQYLVPDALLLSAFALSLYHWSTHNIHSRSPHNTHCRSRHNTHSRSPRPVPLHSAFCLSFRWPIHTVFVSRSHSCAEQKLWVSGFEGSSAASGCRLVTLLPPQGYSSQVAPRYGASLSRWTTIIFALGCRWIRYITSLIHVIML